MVNKKRGLIFVLFFLTLGVCSCSKKTIHMESPINYNEIYELQEEPLQIVTKYEQDLASLSKVTIKKRKGDTVICKIVAPDVYSIIMDHISKGTVFSTEQDLFNTIYEEASSKKCKKRTQNLTINIIEDNGEWYADTSSLEYRDAITGGLYTAINEIANKLASDLSHFIIEEGEK